MSGPEPNSAKIVASAAAAGTLPIATPPSLTMSCDLSSLSLPVPTTTSRGRLRPAGATMSRVDPFLPVKRSAAAARRTSCSTGAKRLAGGGAEFEIFPAEHNKNTAHAGKGGKSKLQGVGHLRSF